MQYIIVSICIINRNMSFEVSKCIFCIISGGAHVPLSSLSFSFSVSLSAWLRSCDAKPMNLNSSIHHGMMRTTKPQQNAFSTDLSLALLFWRERQTDRQKDRSYLAADTCMIPTPVIFSLFIISDKPRKRGVSSS